MDDDTAPAQAQLDALREEVARLKASLDALKDLTGDSAGQLRQERDEARAELAALKAQPTDLIAGTEVVSAPGATLKVQVIHLTEEGKRALTANVRSIPDRSQPTDVDALMALADQMTESKWRQILCAGKEDYFRHKSAHEAAREALRAKLAARKEPK